MGLVALVCRAELRRRWRAWVVLAVLVALVGGVALAAAAAGRRTNSAYPSFVARYGFDAVTFATSPVPALARLPEVASATPFESPLSGQPRCTCSHQINGQEMSVDVIPAGKPVLKLVAGRVPDPSSVHDVLASFGLQHDYGVEIGSVITVPFYSPSQESTDMSSATPPPPRGPSVAFHVVGIEASEGEFPSGSEATYGLYATPAFARTVLPHTAHAYLYELRLRHGAADLPRLTVDVSLLHGSGLLGLQPADTADASVEASIRPQAIGWWVLAVLAALVGAAVVAQSLARQSAVESEDYPTLATLGMRPRQLVALSTMRNAVIGAAGALGAVALATALSPLTPVGEARIAEPSTGVSFDVAVLVLGAVALVLVVIGLGLWPALRAARVSTSRRSKADRPSLVVAKLAAAGAPPAMVVGVRHALERGRSADSVPVRTAALGTVLAVTALCATAVFGSSLANLTTSPRLYGDAFQLNFDLLNGAPPPGVLDSLEHDRAISAVTEGIATDVTIDGATVGALAGRALRGPLLLSAITGHAPDAVGEIGLGTATMRQVRARVGSVVQVSASTLSGAKRTTPFRVVARMALPVLGGIAGLGSGAAFTLSGYVDAVCPPGSGRPACAAAVASSTNGGILARAVPGAAGQAAVDRYLARYGVLVSRPVVPTSLVNFGEAVNFPLIFAVMLAVFGAGTLAHLLAVSVARRRREIGLLKVLGFVNRQVAAAVVWQATALALIGVAVGVAVGVVVGREVWRVFADNIGVIPVSVLRAPLLAIVAAGVLAGAVVLAAVPALVARRARPWVLLRSQ